MVSSYLTIGLCSTNNFELKETVGGIKELYINGLFTGLYSDYSGITQFSGHEDQIFDEDLCVEFLRSLNPSADIYSAISVAGSQLYLQVSFKPLILSEGVQKIHKP